MAGHGARAAACNAGDGFLRNQTLADATHLVAALRQGLTEAGFVEGQNIAIEYRSAEGHRDRLRALVTDLISRQVGVIVGNIPSTGRDWQAAPIVAAS